MRQRWQCVIHNFFHHCNQDLRVKQWRQYQRLKCNNESNPFCFLWRGMSQFSNGLLTEKSKSPPGGTKYEEQKSLQFLWKEKQILKEEISFLKCFTDKWREQRDWLCRHYDSSCNTWTVQSDHLRNHSD